MRIDLPGELPQKVMNLVVIACWIASYFLTIDVNGQQGVDFNTK